MRLKWQSVVAVLSLSLLFSGCRTAALKIEVPTRSARDFVPQTQYRNPVQKTKALENFVQDKLLTSQGIYTNPFVKTEKSEKANGRQMLLESSGLWLNYLAWHHRYAAFRSFYASTKRIFDQQTQFSYRYDPTTRQKSDVNATIDDLRVIRALQSYAYLTKSARYAKEAAKRFALLRQHLLVKGRLVDFYDSRSHQASTTSSLAYYDLKTLSFFQSTTAAERANYRKQLKLVESGYLGDAFPLYAASYQWQTMSYSTQDLNTSEALLTLLHLAEVNRLKASSLAWLQLRVKTQTLYNRYAVSGEVVNQGQSTANYAIAAMIFAQEGKKSWYQKAMTIVWERQNHTSFLAGGFGDPKTRSTYAFDNLEVLLASSY